MTEGPLSATFPGLVRKMLTTAPDRVAIRYEDRVVTYGEIVGRIGAAAAFLRDVAGVRRGDHIAIVMESSPELVVAQYAVQVAGGVAVPIHHGLFGETLCALVDRSHAKVALADPAQAEKLEELRNRLPHLREVHASAGSAYADAAAGRLDPTPLLDEATQGVMDPAFILFTSGTTGQPQGVIMRQLLAGAIVGFGQAVGMREDEVFYICTPMHHGLAIGYVALVFQLEASMVLVRKFSASRYWADIREHGCTFAYHVGTISRMVFNQPPHPDDGVHELRCYLGAGMPAEIWRPFEERFNVKLIEAYSATDGIGGTINLGDGPPGSMGRPPPHLEHRVVDADDNDVPRGEPGELIMRPRVATGGVLVEYYGDPEASREKTRGGWVRTGDLVREDADGWLFFVDRKKDVIRRRGVNMAPAEIERMVCGHDAVAECAAVGVPSELGEDEVKILVVPRGELSARDLGEYATRVLPRHMRPRYVQIVSDLPKSIHERVQRFSLKQGWRTSDTWDCERGAFLVEEAATRTKPV